MILKKPYAFLIKHFRLIHLFLTGLILYLLFSSYNIYDFFHRYASNTIATLADANPSNYITLFMFLNCILVITFSLAMYLLMKKKDKPKTLYIYIGSYYTLLLICYISCFILFKSMETVQLPLKTAMILRDISLILMTPQIPFLLLSLIRGVGFDIKKFNFTKDLKELDISESDNEEFEFILGTDSYKYFRYLRRKAREFKYYILENKFMFTILSGLTGCILVLMIILNFTVYNRTYNKDQTISANNLSIQVNNAYITNTDYNGKEIAPNKYFLILNTSFKNTSGESTVLELINYKIETKKGTVYPTLSRNSHFIDIGAGYAKEKIENNKSADYILVYELNKNQVQDKYKLKIVDEVVYKSGTLNSKVKKVKLKPENYINSSTVGNYKLGKPVTMYESILGDTSLIINSYSLKNKFVYQYEACMQYECSNVTDVVVADAAKRKTLLILNGKFDLDKKSHFARNSKTKMSFFDTFVQIRYDGKISSVIDATPKSLLDKYVLQVNEDITNAKKIDLVITVRNKKYILNLK